MFFVVHSFFTSGCHNSLSFLQIFIHFAPIEFFRIKCLSFLLFFFVKFNCLPCLAFQNWVKFLYLHGKLKALWLFLYSLMIPAEQKYKISLFHYIVDSRQTHIIFAIFFFFCQAMLYSSANDKIVNIIMCIIDKSCT